VISKTKDGDWRVDIQPGGRSGMKRYRKTFSTKGEALAWERDLQGQVANDSGYARQRKDSRRLSELLELWWHTHASHLNSGEDMKARITALIEVVGDLPARTLTSSIFAHYRTTRLAAGLAPATLNREHSYMRSMFNELIRIGEWRYPNPLKQVRQLRVQERELSYLTIDNIAALLRECANSRNDHLTLVVKLALSTGARWSEAEKLPKANVSRGMVTYANTKGLKVRHVPIATHLVEELQQHGLKRPVCPLLFDACYSAFRKAAERAQIELPEGQATHVLRHTFASHFLQRGGNIVALQKILGHSDLKVTMRYAHLAPAHLEEAIRLNPLAV
jgi:site-specific recombinase XerD